MQEKHQHIFKKEEKEPPTHPPPAPGAGPAITPEVWQKDCTLNALLRQKELKVSWVNCQDLDLRLLRKKKKLVYKELGLIMAFFFF